MSLNARRVFFPLAISVLVSATAISPAAGQLTPIGKPFTITEIDSSSSSRWLASRPGGFVISANRSSTSSVPQAQIYLLDAAGHLETTTSFVSTDPAFTYHTAVPVSTTDGIFLAMYRKFTQIGQPATYTFGLYDLPATLPATVTDPVPFYSRAVGSMNGESAAMGATVARPSPTGPFVIEIPNGTRLVWTFRGDGTPITPEPTLIPLMAATAVSGDGTLAVVTSDGSLFHLDRYDTQGALLGSTFVAQNPSPEEGFLPSVMALLDGGFLVSWFVASDSPNEPGYGFNFRIFNRDGTSRTDEIVAVRNVYYFAIVPGEAGDFHVLWSEGSPSVDKVRTYDPHGRTNGEDFPGTLGRYLAIPGGRFLVFDSEGGPPPDAVFAIGTFLQSPTIHADGFETGDASRWSAVH